MSVYRKDKEGNLVKIAGSLTQRINNSILATVHSVENGADYYDVADETESYMSSFADYTNYSFYLDEPNITQEVYFRYKGQALKVISEESAVPAVGELSGQFDCFTLDASTSNRLVIKAKGGGSTLEPGDNIEISDSDIIRLVDTPKVKGIQSTDSGRVIDLSEENSIKQELINSQWTRASIDASIQYTLAFTMANSDKLYYIACEAVGSPYKLYSIDIDDLTTSTEEDVIMYYRESSDAEYVEWNAKHETDYSGIKPVDIPGLSDKPVFALGDTHVNSVEAVSFVEQDDLNHYTLLSSTSKPVIAKLYYYCRNIIKTLPETQQRVFADGDRLFCIIYQGGYNYLYEVSADTYTLSDLYSSSFKSYYFIGEEVYIADYYHYNRETHVFERIAVYTTEGLPLSASSRRPYLDYNGVWRAGSATYNNYGYVITVDDNYNITLTRNTSFAEIEGTAQHAVDWWKSVGNATLRYYRSTYGTGMYILKPTKISSLVQTPDGLTYNENEVLDTNNVVNHAVTLTDAQTISGKKTYEVRPLLSENGSTTEFAAVSDLSNYVPLQSEIAETVEDGEEGDAEAETITTYCQVSNQDGAFNVNVSQNATSNNFRVDTNGVFVNEKQVAVVDDITSSTTVIATDYNTKFEAVNDRISALEEGGGSATGDYISPNTLGVYAGNVDLCSDSDSVNGICSNIYSTNGDYYATRQFMFPDFVVTTDDTGKHTFHLSALPDYVPKKTAPEGQVKAYTINGEDGEDVCLVSMNGDVGAIARYNWNGQINVAVDPENNNNVTRKSWVESQLATKVDNNDDAVAFAESERQKSKNLFDYSNAFGDEHGITNNYDGTFNINTIFYYPSTYFVLKDTIPQGTKLTFSEYISEYFDSDDSYVAMELVCYEDEDANSNYTIMSAGISSTGRFSCSNTLNNDCKMFELRMLRKSNNTSTLTGTVKDIMICVGDDTDYQAYNGEIVHEKDVTPEIIFDIDTKNTIGAVAYTDGIKIGTTINYDFSKYEKLIIYSRRNETQFITSCSLLPSGKLCFTCNGINPEFDYYIVQSWMISSDRQSLTFNTGGYQYVSEASYEQRVVEDADSNNRIYRIEGVC